MITELLEIDGATATVPKGAQTKAPTLQPIDLLVVRRE